MSRHPSADRTHLPLDYSETDLIKLQQQYGKAQEAKRAYTKKTQGLIYRDEREIQRLRDEHERLLSNLRVYESSLKQWTDASVVQDLTAMLARRDRIDEELEAEKGKLASLKDQILKWERKLARQRIGGETSHLCPKADNRNLLKSTCVIEDKLYRGRKCFDNLMARNGELREELKTLHMGKEQFVHDKSLLKKELRALCKDISNLMTKCTEAFNARAKSQEKQRMLRDQDAKDVAQHIKEKSNLEQEISHYCYFEAFLDMKAIARTNQDINHRKVEKYKKVECKELGLEEFEDAIKQILGETEERDLDKLIRDFIQMEEQNYTLLKFVNYQHNEADAMRKQISQLHSESERFVAEGQQQQEQNQARWIKLSIKQEATEQQLAVYQQRVEFMEKLMDQLKEGVESLVKISYGSSVISSEGVQDENIKEYLRQVEDRVNELLTLQSYLQFQKNPSQWDFDSLSTIAGQLLGITAPAVSLTTAAVTPAPDDDPDLVESELQEAKEPMCREDLLTLVNKRLQRKKRD